MSKYNQLKGMPRSCLAVLTIMFSVATYAGEPTASPALATMLEELQSQTEIPFDGTSGERLWYQDFDGRSCTSCHTDSLFTDGRHERTGKVIAPMAPSVNPERLTDRKKMNKWFKRNCKWTLGRECTAQEKGDVLTWLQHM